MFSRFISPYTNIIFSVLLLVAAGTAKYYQWQANRYEAKANHAVQALDKLVEDSARIVAEAEAKHQDALDLSMEMLEQAEKQYQRDKTILLDQVKKGAEHAEDVTTELINERNLNRVLQDRLRASLAERKAIAAYSEGIAESWRECDTASVRSFQQYTQDLELAAAKTTADFNVCRRWMDEACTLFTCGEDN